MNGLIRVRKPRVRGVDERFESKVLRFFKRRSKEVGQMLPELYLHGLAKGDFELGLRGLLGERRGAVVGVVDCAVEGEVAGGIRGVEGSVFIYNLSILR